MKKTFKLIDLDCANCAANMETAIKKLPGVTDASVSFMAQKMTIEAEDVDAAVKGLEVHHTETVGRSKGATVFLKPGQNVDESCDVSVQPVSLQQAFVALCGEEARK